MLTQLKPTQRDLVYDLVTQAGLDTSDWANYRRPEQPATNPKYCYEWAFVAHDRVVLCLWFRHMREDKTGVFQIQNYRQVVLESRNWSTAQKERAWRMDQAFVKALHGRLLIRVIIVDGPAEQEVGEVERRMLDPEPWHIASYDRETGECRIQRGPWPAPAESYTPTEVAIAGTFSEGAQSQVTAQARERSMRLREFARAHFAARSPDGRLRCAVCDWAPPAGLELTGPIVEIHHGVGISTYPTDGRALSFEEAIVHLTPLCPNCHRLVHSKRGGGCFTLDELRRSQSHQDRKMPLAAVASPLSADQQTRAPRGEGNPR